MCGIVGAYHLNSLERINADHKIFNEMLDTINHRGPDAREIYINSKISFGFNRLSIIDIDHGMQPMYSDDYKIIVVCNGEIFNYIELREELEKDGFQFKTRSDIEVLIPLYQKYKHGFLNKINGQFALALYDENYDELIIARDHFGICPMFFTVINNTLVFASEIKALLKYPGVVAELDLVGLDQIMTFPGVISPRTMFQNITSIEAGTFYSVSKRNGIKVNQFWDYDFPHQNTIYNDIDFIEELEDRLLKSVNLRMRSDVPIGMYLSGGLDSTFVLSLLKNQLKANYKIKTFSVDFSDDTLSEKYFQNIATEYFQTQQNTVCMDQNDIISRLDKIVYHSEIPLKETFDTASLALSEMANLQGLKVVLAGQGADELFAGYVGYLFDSIPAVRKKDVSEEEKVLQNKLWADENFFYEKHYKEFEKTKLKIYSEKLKNNFEFYNCLNHPLIQRSKVSNRSKLARRSYIDLKLRLSEHLLTDHGDRMAMANSIEVRYPFLDLDVVDLVMRIPDELKLNGLKVKYILRKCAQKYVPQAIINREKQGFAAGGSPYLLQSKNEYIYDLLSYDRIKRQGIYDPDYVESLKLKYSESGFKIKVPFENDMLMPVITLGIWLEKFNVKPL